MKQISKKDIVYFVNAENMHNAGLNYDNLPDCHCGDERLERIRLEAVETKLLEAIKREYTCLGEHVGSCKIKKCIPCNTCNFATLCKEKKQ